MKDIGMKENKILQLNLNNYEQKGLYLLFEDSTLLSLTENEIATVSKKYWADTTRIPSEVREAADFGLCQICPEKGKKGICFALHPVLPFLDVVDKYASYDKVTAVYKGNDKDLMYVSDTTLAHALQYISVLSLMYYCRTGRKYWRYYYGVNPLMGVRATKNRLYLNIYWLHKGNLEKINKFISEFKKEIRVTSESQARRMRMLCKNDAFTNAFANIHIATEILSFNMEDALNESFHSFDNM
jgi:hypothetical protein